MQHRTTNIACGDDRPTARVSSHDADDGSGREVVVSAAEDTCRSVELHLR